MPVRQVRSSTQSQLQLHRNPPTLGIIPNLVEGQARPSTKLNEERLAMILEVKVFLTMFTGQSTVLMMLMLLNMLPNDVFSSSRLTSFCIAGAIIGSFISLAVYPPRSKDFIVTVRRIALKFGCSAICGFTLTPALLHLLAIKFPNYVPVSDSGDLQANFVIAVSALVSIFGVRIIHKQSARIERLFDRFDSSDKDDSDA